MSRVKPSDCARAKLATLVIAAVTCQSALADTTTLICSNGESSEATSTTIELNEVESVVTIHFGDVHNPGGRPDPLPGGKAGPLAAKFDTNTIVFSWYQDSGTNTTYTINRLTGVVGIDRTYPRQTGIYHGRWTCHLGKPQF